MKVDEKEVKDATKWSVLTELVIKIISPITNMILARVLTPESFGVVATVMMIISFTDIFTDAGFQKYIIQNQFKDDDDENLTTSVAFWTNLGISLFLWMMIYMFSSYLANSVGNPGMEKVIYIGACVLPITSFSSIQIALYRKKLNYRGIAFVRIAVKLVPLLVSVPLALFGWSYWALIIGNIVGELLNAILFMQMSSWKPQFQYSLFKLKEMFLFCGWTFLETLSSWFVTNASIFIVAKHFTQSELGVYKTGMTMVAQITSLISGATIGVLFSALSRIQDDDEQYSQFYYKFLKGIGILVIPLGVGIFLYRDVVRTILLGSQWEQAEVLIGLWGFILAESIIFNDMSGAVVLSKGKPKLLFVSNFVQSILVVIGLSISSKFGFSVIVLMTCFIRVQLPAMQFFWCCSVSNIRYLAVWHIIFPYVCGTIVMSSVSLLMQVYMQGIWLRTLSLLLCVLVYVSVLYAIPSSRRDIERGICLIFRKLVRREK